MSQNPYDNLGGSGTRYGGGAGGDFIDPTPSRTSVLAITALVISIVGCIACILPGPGAFAAIFGGLAIFFIARSGGRLTGTGIAVTAIVLGLFQTVAIIALLIGANQVSSQFGKEFFLPMGQTMSAIEKGDMQGARAMLTPKASAAVTDEMLRDFVKNYHATAGTYQKMPENVLETVTMAIELGKASKQQKGGSYHQRPGEMSFPLPAKFASGSAFVLITMDPTLMGQSKPGAGNPQQTLLNLAVVTLDGKEVYLLDPDEARKLTSKPFGYVPPAKSGGPTSGVEQAPTIPAAKPSDSKPVPKIPEPSTPDVIRPDAAKPGH